MRSYGNVGNGEVDGPHTEYAPRLGENSQPATPWQPAEAPLGDWPITKLFAKAAGESLVAQGIAPNRSHNPACQPPSSDRELFIEHSESEAERYRRVAAARALCRVCPLLVRCIESNLPTFERGGRNSTPNNQHSVVAGETNRVWRQHFKSIKQKQALGTGTSSNEDIT